MYDIAANGSPQIKKSKVALKIRKLGNEFQGYYKNDNDQWERYGDSVTVNMGDTFYAGVAVSSTSRDQYVTISGSGLVIRTVTYEDLEPESMDIGIVNVPGYAEFDSNGMINKLVGAGTMSAIREYIIYMQKQKILLSFCHDSYDF